MQNPIDFKAKNKQIRKLRAAALRRWADRVIAGIDNLLAENLKIMEAIKADQSLPKKERKKLVAKFEQEQTALMCKSAKDIKSKLKSFKNRVSGKVKDLRKGD
jgi:hypothetical protein